MAGGRGRSARGGKQLQLAGARDKSRDTRAEIQQARGSEQEQLAGLQEANNIRLIIRQKKKYKTT